MQRVNLQWNLIPEKLDMIGQKVSTPPSSEIRIQFISIKHESKHIAKLACVRG